MQYQACVILPYVQETKPFHKSLIQNANANDGRFAVTVESYRSIRCLFKSVVLMQYLPARRHPAFCLSEWSVSFAGQLCNLKISIHCLPVVLDR